MKIFKQKNRGFTLIELLVVIAIIGILSAVVLASLNTARQKSRDARRIGDIQQMKLAAAMYYDSNNAYPATLADLVTAKLIPALPVDPQTGTTSSYVYKPSSTTSPNSYVLRATLENTNGVLASDYDGAANAAFTGSPDCTDSSTTGWFYCVQP